MRILHLYFDNSFDQSKSTVRLVRAEKMVLSGLVFARKIARMILIQNIQGLMGPLMFNMAFMPLYMWEMWDVTPVTPGRTDERTVESRAVFSLSWIRNIWSLLYVCVRETLFLAGPEEKKWMNVKVLVKKKIFPAPFTTFE